MIIGHIQLRFWPSKKKTTKPPLKFCNYSSFSPQGKKKHVASQLGCHVSVDRVKIGLGGQNCTCAKLRGRFCSFFFLEGLNRNFKKVRGLKLLLKHFS